MISHCSSGIPFPVSATLTFTLLSTTSNCTSILPPRGVNFRAFDNRLLTIFSSLSPSVHAISWSSMPNRFSVSPFSLALNSNVSQMSFISFTTSICSTLRRRLSFSSLLKSINWFTSLNMRWMLRWAILSRLRSSPSIESLFANCPTGPAIIVNGVRNS